MKKEDVAIIKEAAGILELVGEKFPRVADVVHDWRWPLADELYGLASMLKDELPKVEDETRKLFEMDTAARLAYLFGDGGPEALERAQLVLGAGMAPASRLERVRALTLALDTLEPRKPFRVPVGALVPCVQLAASKGFSLRVVYVGALWVSLSLTGEEAAELILSSISLIPDA